jgi:hypothetical protein
MNIAKCAQATSIMNNVKSGHYIRGAKFANFGSVVTDSIFAQQREADRRLKEIKAARALKFNKNLL